MTGSKNDLSVESWLFMHSPVYVLSVLVFYLYFVLKLGPQLMKNRPPFELKNLLMVYNGCQVLFSAWLCYIIFPFENSFEALKNCNPVTLSKEQVEYFTIGAWWFFFGKLTELLDTIFFVLRKKQSQVTFLHVYHHSITITGSWLYCKYTPYTQGALLAVINSAIHVVMYFYYFIASSGPKYRKYLWWKKYITRLQLVQFCLGMGYLAYLLAMNCNYHTGMMYFFIINDAAFLILFTNFYTKTYSNNMKK